MSGGDPGVQPALSREEWARPATKDNVGEIRELTSDPTPENRHALAALALYQQPFGFTRDDLTTLDLAISAAYGAYASLKLRDEEIGRMKSLRTRIAALLPPGGEVSDWTIESVEIKQVPPMLRTPEFPLHAPGNLLAIATGRTADDRVFQYMALVTQELLDDYGEERVKEMIRADARPSEP